MQPCSDVASTRRALKDRATRAQLRHRAMLELVVVMSSPSPAAAAAGAVGGAQLNLGAPTRHQAGLNVISSHRQRSAHPVS